MSNNLHYCECLTSKGIKCKRISTIVNATDVSSYFKQTHKNRVFKIGENWQIFDEQEQKWRNTCRIHFNIYSDERCEQKPKFID
jgi:N-acetylneuraminic acid mutarotase